MPLLNSPLNNTHAFYKVVWMDGDVNIVFVPKKVGYAGAEKVALALRSSDKGKTKKIKSLNRLK